MLSRHHTVALKLGKRRISTDLPYLPIGQPRLLRQLLLRQKIAAVVNAEQITQRTVRKLRHRGESALSGQNLLAAKGEDNAVRIRLCVCLIGIVKLMGKNILYHCKTFFSMDSCAPAVCHASVRML